MSSEKSIKNIQYKLVCRIHTAFSVFIAKNLCFPSPAPYTYPNARASVISLDMNEIL